ncbi:transglycosylase SLT domain-containing protein [Microbulbifer variabilis]|uniref:transglycosylase SLT domain-containing protein n=1 Tax=Microbulbifer variabilis TaxID=266805 RepID=UPI001CFE63EE|nr:transglycosylase SLT domain-containing protein [Microbulbifer variabilis]
MSVSTRGLPQLFAPLLIWACLGAQAAPLEPAKELTQQEESSLETSSQRQLLQQARLAIKHGDKKQLKQLRAKLTEYPLTPYLDYWALSRKMRQLPLKEIDLFLEENQGTAIGDWMRIRLLRELGQQNQFRNYLKYYQPEKHSNSVLRCYYADALFRHGSKEKADRVTTELWLVGHSQAEECDPVFAHWMRHGGLTQEKTWARHLLALKEGNLELASYIARKMDAANVQRATVLREVHKSPKLLLNYSRFLQAPEQNREIILHGLHRLAREDATVAEQAWQRYSASLLFSDVEQVEMLRHLARQFARQDNIQGLLQLTKNHTIDDGYSIEWLARQSLRELDWEQVAFWIDRLPPELQQRDRWLYWKARSLEEIYGKTQSGAASLLYRKAARERSYYGFLAADALGQNYSFVDRPAPITPVQVQQMAQRADLQRARELQAIGELFHARREWSYATRDMDHGELLAAGKVASAWGWYHKSIQSVLAADYLDDLELRFPLAFANIVESVSEQVGRQSTALEPYMIFAIARQESHFSHDAKSRSGALGLMQLLPSTARATAKRAGVHYRRSWDLLSPKTNIALGSFYLSTLLNRFDNNRFLAAAAYNAGPTRVAKWLKETRQRLPHDVWIETIPYSETRNYVQNVLAYTVIYAYRSGTKLQLLRANEESNKL